MANSKNNPEKKNNTNNPQANQTFGHVIHATTNGSKFSCAERRKRESEKNRKTTTTTTILTINNKTFHLTIE